MLLEKLRTNYSEKLWRRNEVDDDASRGGIGCVGSSIGVSVWRGVAIVMLAGTLVMQLAKVSELSTHHISLRN
jgi:hypothetical protein